MGPKNQVPPASSSEEEEEHDLSKMTKADLEKLAKTLKLPTNGTKAEILVRIQQKKAESKENNTIQPGKETDGWREAVKQRQPKLNVDVLPLDWGHSGVQLTPSIWPVVMWREPIEKSAIYGPVGTDGTLIEALKKRWRHLLGCSELDVERIKTWWLIIWIAVSKTEKGVTPEMWCRDNWALLVVPAVRGVRLLQAERMQSHGFSRTAQRLRAYAAVPTEELGFDCAELVEKSLLHPSSNEARGSNGDKDDDGWKRKRGNADRTNKAYAGGAG